MKLFKIGNINLLKPRFLCILCAFIGLGIIIFNSYKDGIESKEHSVIAALILLLVFGIFSGLMVIFSSQMIAAWNESFIGYLSLVIIFGGSIYVFNHMPFADFLPFRPIFILVTLAYFILLAMGVSIRLIKEYADKSED